MIQAEFRVTWDGIHLHFRHLRSGCVPKLPRLASFNSQTKEIGACLKNFQEDVSLALDAVDRTQSLSRAERQMSVVKSHPWRNKASHKPEEVLGPELFFTVRGR